jgi:FlaA1/EpsC-like NDP-sugar epimerase
MLKEQIEKGQPLTITHKDMARYFMVIPEAVSLVLKAASIAQAGDITLLKMGQQIKIVDLAKSLIALMGKTEAEVPIVFTGIRPGEKLSEELYLCGNELQTSDPDVLILPKGDRDREASSVALDDGVERMIRLAQTGNNEAVYILSTLAQCKQLGDPAPIGTPDMVFPEGSRDALPLPDLLH